MEKLDKAFLKSNRDGILPKPLRVVKSNEVLSNALKQYLNLPEMDLGSYLRHLILQRPEPFVDEYGQVIHAYHTVFNFIWEQYNETLVDNYAIGQFEKDKLNMCSVARYLSHQSAVENRQTLMKRMSDSLGYRCHPCTPYKREEYDSTVFPDYISQEGVTPEESIILCKEITTSTQRTSPTWISTTGKNTYLSFIFF